VKLSDVQAGRIGEYLLAVYSMLTSDGELVPAFTPFRAETKEVGPRLLKIIANLPATTKPQPGARLLIRRR
jgi:hypothetical protein